MTYAQFKDSIHRCLRQNPDGFRWVELRDKLHLPYERPCPEWTRRLENEMGLVRRKGKGRAFVWKTTS